LSDVLFIRNNGPLIAATNYWETELAAAGKMYLSTNDKAFRLLLPTTWEKDLPELATGKRVIVSRPRNPGKFEIELLFEDDSPSPYVIHLSAGQIERVPLPEDDGRGDLECTVWTQPRRGVPHEALRRPAAYRLVPRLPWLKPWSKLTK